PRPCRAKLPRQIRRDKRVVRLRALEPLLDEQLPVRADLQIRDAARLRSRQLLPGCFRDPRCSPRARSPREDQRSGALDLQRREIARCRPGNEPAVEAVSEGMRGAVYGAAQVPLARSEQRVRTAPTAVTEYVQTAALAAHH